MTQLTILIGKNRRITLDEINNVSHGFAKLEMVQTDPTTNDSTTATTTTDESANVVDAVLSSALDKLSLDNEQSTEGGGELLSPEATIASLTLLSLTLSQGRVVRGDCAIKVASSLVHIVNTIVTAQGDSSSNKKKVRLGMNGNDYVKGLDTLLVGSDETKLQGVVEGNASYLVRCISLARVSLMLARGTYVCFCFVSVVFVCHIR